MSDETRKQWIPNFVAPLITGALLLLLEYAVIKPIAENGVVPIDTAQPSPPPSSIVIPPTVALSPTQNTAGSLIDWINWIGIVFIVLLLFLWLRYTPAWIKKRFQRKLTHPTDILRPDIEVKLESVKNTLFGWPLAALIWVLGFEFNDSPLGISIGLLAAIMVYAAFTMFFTPKYYSAPTGTTRIGLRDFWGWFLLITPAALFLYFILRLLSVTTLTEFRTSFPLGINWIGLWSSIILNGVIALIIGWITRSDFTLFRLIFPALTVIWFVMMVLAYLVVLVIISGNVDSFVHEWMKANAYIKSTGLGFIDQMLFVSKLISQEINKTTMQSRLIAAVALPLIISLPGQFYWLNWISKEQQKTSAL